MNEANIYYSLQIWNQFHDPDKEVWRTIQRVRDVAILWRRIQEIKLQGSPKEHHYRVLKVTQESVELTSI